MRRGIVVLVGSVAVTPTALLGACGGRVDNGATAVVRPEAPPLATGGGAGQEDGGAGGSASGAGGGGGQASTLPDARYDDPGCAPTDKIEGPRECDVRAQTGCARGDRCVPYVRYGEQCSAEIVGTRCVVAGSATQGEDCSVDECAPGFVCVTGGGGFVCARLCELTGPDGDCPPGLLCSPLDVDGFSVCG